MCEQAQKNNSRSKSHSKWLTHRLDGCVVALSAKIYSPAKISKGGTTESIRERHHERKSVKIHPATLYCTLVMVKFSFNCFSLFIV